MSLDFVALDHNCNVVRREVEEEFRNLSIIFIPHAPDERKKAFEDKRSLILSKAHGKKIYDVISLSHCLENDHTEFMGLVVHNAHNLNIFGKKHYTAIFFINTDDPLFQDNSKQATYHLAWHALSLYQRVSGIGQDKDKTSKGQTRIIKPRYNDLKLARNNLMADIFGAILVEAEGQNGIIEALAQRRSLLSLKPTPFYLAENYPYPMTVEACRLLYDDLKTLALTKHQPIHQALELTQEVCFTFNEESVLQWWEFSKSAQDMAWKNNTPQDILGYAIYTSDNTDVRALAYQIAELLDMDPASQSLTQGEYNAFASERNNRRARDLACEDIFSRLISIAAIQNDGHIFRTEIIKQNENLLKGRVYDWCAPSLSAAADAFDTALKAPPQDDQQHPSELAAQAFYKSQKSLHSETIEELGLCILTLRRMKPQPNMLLLKKALTQRSDLSDIKDYLDGFCPPEPLEKSSQHMDIEDMSEEARFIREKLSEKDNY
jgi:hypothetical protein